MPIFPDFSLTISWLAAILPYTMSNINFLFSYPSDLYLKGYSENAAQVDYLSCSFRSVYWGLSRCVMRFWWDDILTTFQLFKICDCILGPVHTTPEELENGGFTLKTHQMFSVHTTPDEFQNATIRTSHLGICVWVTLRQGSHVIMHDKHSLIVFSKRKMGVFKYLRCEKRFRKAPFPWRIKVDERLNRRKKSRVFKFLRFEERFRKPPFSCQISLDGRPKRRLIKLRFHIYPA